MFIMSLASGTRPLTEEEILDIQNFGPDIAAPNSVPPTLPLPTLGDVETLPAPATTIPPRPLPGMQRLHAVTDQDYPRLPLHGLFQFAPPPPMPAPPTPTHSSLTTTHLLPLLDTSQTMRFPTAPTHTIRPGEYPMTMPHASALARAITTNQDRDWFVLLSSAHLQYNGPTDHSTIPSSASSTNSGAFYYSLHFDHPPLARTGYMTTPPFGPPLPFVITMPTYSTTSWHLTLFKSVTGTRSEAFAGYTAGRLFLRNSRIEGMREVHMTGEYDGPQQHLYFLNPASPLAQFCDDLRMEIMAGFYSIPIDRMRAISYSLRTAKALHFTCW